MKISTEFIEKNGFKKVNNSTWRNGNCTLQSKYYSRSIDRNVFLIKAFRACSYGKFITMVDSENDFYNFMGIHGS
jgi:hypothetical protein